MTELGVGVFLLDTLTRVPPLFSKTFQTIHSKCSDSTNVYPVASYLWPRGEDPKLNVMGGWVFGRGVGGRKDVNKVKVQV